jgi:hypothetical protein
VADPRLLEDGSDRLLEDGSDRLMEDGSATPNDTDTSLLHAPIEVGTSSPDVDVALLHAPVEVGTSRDHAVTQLLHAPVEVGTSRDHAVTQLLHAPVEVGIENFNDLMMPPILACQVPLGAAGEDQTAMTSASHRDYGGDPWGGIGQVKSRWASPVTTSREQLGGTQLLDGRAVLHWVKPGPVNETGYNRGAKVKIAVLASLNDAMVDGAVDPGDEIELPFDHVVAASVWQHQGELHLFVAYRDEASTERRVEHWTFDDPGDPATSSLSKRANLMPPTTASAASSFYLKVLTRGNQMMGYPLVLRSGRWVLTGVDLSPFGSGASLTRAAIYTSDDRGGSWQKRASILGPSFSVHNIAATVARDPMTGYLYFAYTHGPVGDSRVMRSADEGATWQFIFRPGAKQTQAVFQVIRPNRRLAYYGDNGDNMFLVNYGSFSGIDPDWRDRGENIVVNPNVYDENNYLDLDIGWEISQTSGIGSIGGKVRVAQFAHLDTAVDDSGTWDLENGTGPWMLEDGSGPWMLEERNPHYTVYREASFVIFDNSRIITSDFTTGNVRIR